ncbi:hypothetical protein LIP_1021 [Limnochorda pilosa]|uniref:ADP-dependent glucokinase n=2 Tax=Limnochorda pilosa TaxID=1555112 RepID=A0A0K2SIE5_LIMPI|nr:hypothetical protein LIP_1021 [Limnochorda pilosa]
MNEGSAGTWQALAEEAVAGSRQALPQAGGAALAFHSVADGLVHLDGPRVARLVAGAGGEAVAAPLLDQPRPPKALHSPKDLVAALLFSLQRGQALQRMIVHAPLHRWLQEVLGYDELRLGGTSANMAVAVASLGIDPTIVYAYPPSRRVASLFPPLPGLRAFTGRPGNPLLPVSDWAGSLPRDESPESPLHWILEYGPEMEVQVGSLRLRPPRANRFIAGWNPANRRLRLEPAFVDGLEREAGRLGFFFLSGYHILAEGDEGGEAGFTEAVGSTATLVDRVRRANPRVTAHLEMASIGSEAVRREVLTRVVPRVSSVGMNEAELETIAADLGIPWFSPGSGADRLARLVRATLEVSRVTGLRRMHVHDLGNYAIVLGGGQDEGEAVAARAGLLFAGAVAAARARTGELSPRSGQDSLAEPFSPEGLRRLERLDEVLAEKGAERRGPGIWRLTERWIVAVPSRVVERPRRTVGLGDTISASALLAETALRR